MTPLVIIFVSSFIILGIFLGIKVMRLRSGQLTYKSILAEYSLEFPKIDVEKTRKMFFLYVRKYGLLTALTLSKIWIITHNQIKNKVKEKYPKMTKFFNENKDLQKNLIASPFLHAITEYKIKIKRFKEKMKEMEETKSDN